MKVVLNVDIHADFNEGSKGNRPGYCKVDGAEPSSCRLVFGVAIAERLSKPRLVALQNSPYQVTVLAYYVFVSQSLKIMSKEPLTFDLFWEKLQLLNFDLKMSW